MNEEDMRARGLGKYDLIDVTSFAKDGSTRSVGGYRVAESKFVRRQLTVGTHMEITSRANTCRHSWLRPLNRSDGGLGCAGSPSSQFSTT